MGLTQTKLHHKVLQENWAGIRRRLRTEDGGRWVRTRNPCGDYPLHLACYGGHAPPSVIRALVAAFPDALFHRNDLGFLPLDLARSNYRPGHPYRREVLEYLAAYADDGARREPPPATTTTAATTTQRILDGPSPGAQLSGTYVSGETCVVCLEDPADHVVAPCGHMCLCGGCARRVLEPAAGAGAGRCPGDNKPRTCPVCRAEFGSIIRVAAVPATTTPQQPHALVAAE